MVWKQEECGSHSLDGFVPEGLSDRERMHAE